ncbi:hypothetical protein LCL95_01640 [Bacillus timonensis]|nr:hypothetical protein [Bacillus timonensis]
MRKRSILFFIMVVTMVLGGCGTSLTKDEVVNKALEMDINSFNMDANIEMEIEANGQSMDQSLNMEMTFVDDPFVAHILMSTFTGNIEMYIDKETTYLANIDPEVWVKTPTKDVPEFAEMADVESLKKEVERLKEFSDLFTMEKNENNEYVLSVNFTEESSEEENELVRHILLDSLEDLVVDDIKVNSFTYKLTFDENFLLQHDIVEADLEIVSEGETVKIILMVDAKYSDINAIKDYQIPNEIIDNAIDATEE